MELDSITLPIWRTLAFRLVVLLLGSAAVYFFLDERWAVTALALGMAAMLYVQTRNLIAINRWMKDPRDDTFPDTGGLWGEVFLNMARHLRRLTTDRDQAEQELKQFAEAVEALPDGVVLLDEHGAILWSNRQAERHLGVRPGVDKGRMVTQIFRTPGFNTFLSTDGMHTFAFSSSLHPTASRRIRLDKERFGEGRVLLISFDITDIDRADAMRRDFIANVSHELRTPLTVVNGFLEHLADGQDVPEEQKRRFVQLMNEQSTRMLRLVDDLLTLSRLDGGTLNKDDEIDLEPFLETLCTEGTALSGGRHTVRFEGTATGTLLGSRHELHSAFGNLISNAVRYTPSGGEIIIRWESNRFSVSDNGVGIPAEHIPRLTERFYRVDKGRSRETGGTGLGLAIVKHVLARHEAKLSIESQENVGSTFSVTFPASRCR